jgi:hypothetical protein
LLGARSSGIAATTASTEKNEANDEQRNESPVHLFSRSKAKNIEAL